jgi:hypothetical protein
MQNTDDLNGLSDLMIKNQITAYGKGVHARDDFRAVTPYFRMLGQQGASCIRFPSASCLRPAWAAAERRAVARAMIVSISRFAPGPLTTQLHFVVYFLDTELRRVVSVS